MVFDQRQRVLERRQQMLQRRSATLRSQLAQDAQVLQAPLALADQVRDGWRWLRANPGWVLAAAGLLVLLRPRRAPRLLWRLGSRAWAGWQLWRRLRGWGQAVTGRPVAPAESWQSVARRLLSGPGRQR